eukprot:4723717-Lingulodinium_polyedra.AAC.1
MRVLWLVREQVSQTSGFCLQVACRPINLLSLGGIWKRRKRRHPRPPLRQAEPRKHSTSDRASSEDGRTACR